VKIGTFSCVKINPILLALPFAPFIFRNVIEACKGKQEMETSGSKETYIYRINKNDIIVYVSDNWNSFANENFGSHSCNKENVVGFSMWKFIHDLETLHLYKILLRKVRWNRFTARFPFRCDSPGERRFLELLVVPLKDKAIEFRSQLILAERREPIDLLKHDLVRSDEYLRICSLCKKIAVSETEWQEVEIALATLKLFEKDKMPKLTHGICSSCHDSIITGLDSQS
jgi:hypothetical protein